MSRYIKNEDNTVTDTKTGLVWSHTIGRAKDGKAADKLATEFGPEFRLPNPEELQTIVDRSKHSPAIDTDAFPDTENAWYWTSEPCAWDKSARWVVNFSYGHVDGYVIGVDACVRAVRGGQ